MDSGNYLELLKEDIVRELNIGKVESLESSHALSTGLSGAEIYPIRLLPPSECQGRYFLKIDLSSREGENQKLAASFQPKDGIPFVCTAIKAAKITKGGHDYFILLTPTAGKSSLEYGALFTLCGERFFSDSVASVIDGILKAEFRRDSFSPKSSTLSDICRRFLGDRINPSDDGVIVTKVLQKRLTNPMAPKFALPDFYNALYFANENAPKMDDIPVPIHGDFHGNNIFIHKMDSSKFSVIDWALCREDGFLFYDSAYLELSLLLWNIGDESLDNWQKCVESIQKEDWKGLQNKCKSTSGLRAIHETEKAWIEKVTNSTFQYWDSMTIARLVARVLAGLNYAGKRKIKDEYRERAFLFSCSSLTALFQLLNYKPACLSDSIPIWGRVKTSPNIEDEAKRLAENCSSFSGDYWFILFRGSKVSDNFSAEAADLAKIPWGGIISLSADTDDFYRVLRESKSLRTVTLRDNGEDFKYLSKSAPWWLFADGSTEGGLSVSLSFSRWRNSRLKSLDNAVEKVVKEADPAELRFLIDLDSFTSSDLKKLDAILQSFDGVLASPFSDKTSDEFSAESFAIGMDILEGAGKWPFKDEDFEFISAKIYQTNLFGLASYANSHLSCLSNPGIWIPSTKKRPVKLSDDVDLAGSHLEIIGNHLLSKSITDISNRGLYWGEKASWDAIHAEVPLRRSEIETYIRQIETAINQQRLPDILEWSYKPGAGMTVLAQMVCWHFRNEYPVIRVLSWPDDFDVNLTAQSIWSVYTVSGKPILILMDGDFTRQNAQTLKEKLIDRWSVRKVLIVLSCRVYSDNPARAETLSTLGDIDAEKFQKQYVQEITGNPDYKQDLENREHNLENLTTHPSMIEFRMPFFYGMFAFESDFVSLKAYMDNIKSRMESDEAYKKTVSYMALVSYYTSDYGLGGVLLCRLRGEHSNLRKLREWLNQTSQTGTHSKVVVLSNDNQSLRICHPIIAQKILLDVYGKDGSFATKDFTELCKDFIAILKNLIGQEQISEYYDALLQTLLINREENEETTSTDKKPFSKLILDVKTPFFQKEIMSALVTAFPKNAHYHQHYGRLLISLSPLSLGEATPEFEEAIKWDEGNPSHRHAFGNMYKKHCEAILRERYPTRKNPNPQDIYNDCKFYVERALQEFDASLNMALEDDHKNFQLSYPYTSTLSLCSQIIETVTRCYWRIYHTKDFWKQDAEYTRWCSELMAHACSLCDSGLIIPEVQNNEYFNDARERLKNIPLNLDDVEAKINIYRNDDNWRYMYLGYSDAGRSFDSADTDTTELEKIRKYCEDIREPGDGVLWRWFNAYTHLPSFQYQYAIDFLEKQQLRDNASSHYLLHVLYFCKYLSEGRLEDIRKSSDHLQKCNNNKDTPFNSLRRNCRFYIAGTQRSSLNSPASFLTTSRTNACYLPCTIAHDIVRDTEGKMKLDTIDSISSSSTDNSRFFPVFFVPYRNNLPIGRGFGQKVTAKIGFSYNGLCGYELQNRRAED